MNTKTTAAKLASTTTPSIRSSPASPARTTRHPSPFSLRKGLGFWDLTRGAERATIKHEKGLEYIAWLMAHPGESLHALDLAARIAAINGEAKSSGITVVENPFNGEKVQVQAHARIQERGLNLDDAIAMRRVLRKQHQLEAYVEDEDNTGPEKDEAYQELIALYDYEKTHGPGVRDTAGKASDAVGRAIKRLYNHLTNATNADGTPNQLVRAFGDHIRECILIPSGRAFTHGGIRPPQGQGGFFVYELPEESR